MITLNMFFDCLIKKTNWFWMLIYWICRFFANANVKEVYTVEVPSFIDRLGTKESNNLAILLRQFRTILCSKLRFFVHISFNKIWVIAYIWLDWTKFRVMEVYVIRTTSKLYSKGCTIWICGWEWGCSKEFEVRWTRTCSLDASIIFKYLRYAPNSKKEKT